MACATAIATLRAMKRWILAWAGAPELAIVNGAARETLYADAVVDDARALLPVLEDLASAR